VSPIFVAREYKIRKSLRLKPREEQAAAAKI